MNITSSRARILLAVAGFLLAFSPRLLFAAGMDDYCITPPFITAGIQPNLLLLLDNSASMYDLAYADKGTATRTPTYCYDNTYSDASGAYAGYFKSDSFYEFNIDAGYFEKIVSFPVSGSCTYYVANKYCIATDTGSPKRVTKFAASGNYLNWMTASKFDIQKKILTGGKYEGNTLVAESRGCVGRGFIKQPLSSNNGNYVEGGTNTPTDISIQVRGASTSYDETAPSDGGQTYLYFYFGGAGIPFNNEICKTAIGNLTDGTSMSGPDKQTVLDCIGAGGGTVDLSGKKKQIFNQSLQECWQYNKNSPPSIQGNDYLTVKNFCSDVYNLRDNDHGPLSFNPASDITVGDPDLLCSRNYVGACYSGARNVAALDKTPSGLFDFLLPKAAYAAPPPAGNFQFSSATYSVSEGAGTATITITRTGGDQGDATVTYKTDVGGTATAGSDYSAIASGTVVFANKQTSKTFTVAITDDATSEPNETINLTLVSTSAGSLGTQKTAVLTILDNDGAPPAGTIALSSATYSVTEGSPVTVTLTRTGGSAGALSVTYAIGGGTAVAGTHYGNPSSGVGCTVSGAGGTCTWAAGDTANKTFTVPTYNNVFSGSVTFNVNLTAGSGTTLGTPASAVVSIFDDAGDGSINLSSSSYTIAQEVSPLTVTLTRSGGNSGLVTVQYTTTNGTAIAGTDYTATSGSLSWANGTGGSKTFTIPIINTGSVTNKTFTVSITVTSVMGSLGPVSSATVTITGVEAGPGTWTNSWNGCVGSDCGNDCVKAQHEKYCGGLAIPPVTDPTDAPGDTALHGNLPAVLADMAVAGQLGAPLKILSGATILDAIPVRLEVTEPSGLIQQFGNKIRVGLMSFNNNGSASECAAGSSVPCPRICSNNTSKTCSSYLDCCRNSDECSCDTSTANVTNADGAKLLYPVGRGTCSNGTICTTNDNCTGVCTMTTSGSHGSGLVQQIDGLRASNWTPFSEAFYNAIGYFARTAPTTSRIAVRLNPIDAANAAQPIDFPENLNPSQFPCQQNYVLLITDGSSAADQNSSVATTAGLYKTAAGLSGGACLDHQGSSNLPILSWLAYHRNISNFNTSGTASTTTPVFMRDRITTYVVFNGQDNGVGGECNSTTLLNNTATMGGGRFYASANNPQQLENDLRDVFEEIAAKAASGTAASILSNSEGSGANILQAVFYPRKIFDNATEAIWVGEMQNLWYYVDPYINNSTIREDTDNNLKLSLISDYVTRFVFDSSSDRTMVQRLQDSDGDGTGDVNIGSLIDPDYVRSIWRAGKLLWERDLSSSPRTIKTSVDGSTLIDFLHTEAGGEMYKYLDVPAADAQKLVAWVKGTDQTGYRSREVEIRDPITNETRSGTWRLGDIISSTPRVQSTVRLNSYNLSAPGGYSDTTYQAYIDSSSYKNRGMVYVGGNDGMFHAFKLGILSVKATGSEKASLSGTGLGREEWAYIPKNLLPYLKYLADNTYKHLYGVDGRTMILDASIGDGGASYWTEAKTASSWRTVVIGGMGIGGASRKSCDAPSTDNCVPTPIDDPGDATKGLGYSSYFALDVTNPGSPQLLWEFTNDQLGYSTTGPAIVRVGDRDKNGRWFAVFGNGPFGPIDTTTHQFKGQSSQPLRFFVVDLASGTLVTKIETPAITNAFAGSMLGASIDADRRDPTRSGNYQDDALYVGYVKKCETDTGICSGNQDAWADGGVVRIITKENTDPNQWVMSTVIDGIGPVTTSIARTQDTRTIGKNLWLYFGTGRYFFRDSTGLDDFNARRTLFGIKEPCYDTADAPGNVIDPSCTAPVTDTLVNQTSSVSAISDTDGGWRIDMDAATTDEAAERVVTDTVALMNGVVYFTSFKPTMDICGYGGNSYLWAVKYDTGGAPDAKALKGKALVQLSSGEFKEIDLATAFTDKGGRRMQTPMTGKPPSDAPPIISNSMNKPLKKILHIQER